MKKVFICIFLILTTLFLSNITILASEIIVDSDAYMPAIDGSNVTYFKQGSLYLYDINTGSKTLVANSAGSWAHISGNYIVYTSDRYSGTNVMLYDIGSATSQQINSTPVQNVFEIDISGSWVVWHFAQKLYGYNILEKREYVLAEIGYRADARIDGNLVLVGNNSQVLRIFNMTTGETRILRSPNNPDPQNPQTSITTEGIIGNKIFWWEYDGSNWPSMVWSLYLYDYDSEQINHLTTFFEGGIDKRSHDHSRSSSTEKIVYSSMRDGRWAIYTYDLINMKEEKLFETIGLAETAISNEYVVWHDRASNHVKLAPIFSEPDINIVPNAWDFGTVEWLDAHDAILTITNSGGQDLVLDSISLLYGGQGYSLRTSTTNFTIPAGESEEFEVIFRPPTVGLYGDTIQIASNDPDEGLIEIPVLGEGVLADEPSKQVDAVLSYIDSAVADSSLYGIGSGNSSDKKVKVLKDMIEAFGDLIDMGYIEEGCGQLSDLYKKLDGKDSPPDFIGGEATDELRTSVEAMLSQHCGDLDIGAECYTDGQCLSGECNVPENRNHGVCFEQAVDYTCDGTSADTCSPGFQCLEDPFGLGWFCDPLP